MAEEEKEDKEAAERKEGEGEGEEGLVPPKKGLGKKKMLIIGAIVGVVALGGIGAGLYFSGLLGGSAPTPEGEVAGEGQGKGGEHEGAAASHEGAHEGGPEEKNAAPVFFSLGDILVNLTGDGKRPNFLKLKVSLEITSEKDKEELETLKPRIIDNFQVYLRELRIEDLRGSAGIYRLREELLLRVTETVKPLRVKDVLFQEMLVQ